MLTMKGKYTCWIWQFHWNCYRKWFWCDVYLAVSLTAPCQEASSRISTFGIGPSQLMICSVGQHASIDCFSYIMRKGKHFIHFRDFLQGNVVNWNKSTWKLTNVTIENLNKKTVCKLPEKRNVLFPTQRIYKDHKLLCTTLNGKITVVNSSELQDSLIEEFKEKITSLSVVARGKYK